MAPQNAIKRYRKPESVGVCGADSSAHSVVSIVATFFFFLF